MICSLNSCTSHQLQLAVLAKQLVALPAFQRAVRKLLAHTASDFFNHFLLQLVLNFRILYVKLRNWLRPHNPLNCLIRNCHIEFFRNIPLVLVVAPGLFLLLLKLIRIVSLNPSQLLLRLLRRLKFVRRLPLHHPLLIML